MGTYSLAFTGNSILDKITELKNLDSKIRQDFSDGILHELISPFVRSASQLDNLLWTPKKTEGLTLFHQPYPQNSLDTR